MGVPRGTDDGNAPEVIHELHETWKDIYRCIGLRPGVGTEALRFAATLRSSSEVSKVVSEEDAVDVFRWKCNSGADALVTSQWLLEVARAVDALHQDRRRSAVTKIVHARLLAVAIMLHEGLDRESLMGAWERVTFRIFGMCQKDARHKVGDYVRRAWGLERYSSTNEQVLERLRSLGTGEFAIGTAIERVKDRNCYEGWSEELRYFLARYEEHLASEAGQAFDNEQWQRIWEASPSTTIEHIQPQSKGSSWCDDTEIFVHRLGNLLLLPPGLNSKLGDDDPPNKAHAYRSTGLLAAIDVADRVDEWTREAVARREDELLAWATEFFRD